VFENLFETFLESAGHEAVTFESAEAFVTFGARLVVPFDGTESLGNIAYATNRG
jgi:hypothetical protein